MAARPPAPAVATAEAASRMASSERATAPPVSTATTTAALVDTSSRSGAAAPIANGPSAQAFMKPARGFWVQLGAVRERDGAAALQRRVGDELAGLSPLLAVFNEAALFRLQAGPYASRDDARDAAESIRSALQLVTVIVERR